MTTQTDATLFPTPETLDTQAGGPRSPLDTLSQTATRLSQQSTGQLRRSTLITLRWTAVAGQLLTLIIVIYVLGFAFPFWPCLAAIFISATVNTVITLTLPLDRRVGHREAITQLGFDLLQLYTLLWFTGGMTNPFALLFVAPVVFSATTLSRRVLFTLAGLASILSFSLLYFSHPLPWRPGEDFAPPFVFRLGMWVALVVGICFTSLYAWRAARETRRMSEALTSTESALSDEKKLTALGGLAAAAAHELGSPLATIQVIAKEMTREVTPGTHLAEDAQLMLSQAQRCSAILKQLALRGDEGDAIHDSLTLRSLIEEASLPYRTPDIDFDISVSGTGPAPNIGRQAELLYGLKNLIENAASFARSQVDISGQWTADTITIDIADNGSGFNPSVWPRLGEPYVSGRDNKDKAGGLGLGIFIAKTLIERTGGHIRFGESIYGGAEVSVSWPRARIADRPVSP